MDIGLENPGKTRRWITGIFDRQESVETKNQVEAIE
jgi:hypothetical protein